MISLPNPKMSINRQQLIEDYAHLVVDGMDLDTLVEFAFDTISRNLEELSDSQLKEEVEQYYPELLDD